MVSTPGHGVPHDAAEARMGVSMTAANADGIEELKLNKEKIVLVVHSKKGIRCVWMLLSKTNTSVTTGHFERKERIRVSLCRAKSRLR